MPGGLEPRSRAAAAPRRGRRAVRLAAGCVLLLAALAAALAWLGSAEGLRWAAARGGVRLQGVQGSVWSGLRVARLQWSRGTTRVDARALVLRWRPRDLLRLAPQLHVLELSAGELDLQQGASASAGGAPSRPAAQLAPPLALRVDALRVGRLRWRRAGQGAWQDLGSLRARVRGDAAAWQLAGDWNGPWGSARTSWHMAARAPFALRGSLGAELNLRHQPLQLDSRVDGTLEHPRLEATLKAWQARAVLRAELLPFEPVWLGPSSVDLHGLDPRRIDPALPRAELSLRARLRGTARDALRGELALRNALPGSADAGRLPLSRLDSALSLQGGVLRASGLHAALAGGGSLDGSIAWPLDASATVDLQARALDLHALYARLLATRLQGRLQATLGAQAQSLSATLSQPGWQALLRVRHAGRRIDVERARLQAQGAELSLAGSLEQGQARAFSLRARLHDFDPRRFGDWPRARLNLQLQAQGDLAAPSARVALRVEPSRWRGQPLQGSASGLLTPRTVRDVQAALRLGANRLQAQGSFGRPGDSLRLQLQAPALAQLGEGWSGSAQARATVHGGLPAPSGRLVLHARELRGPDSLRLARLDLDAQIAQGLQGPLRVQASGQDLRMAGQSLRELALQLRGTLRAHTLKLRLLAPPRLRLQASAQGSWLPAKGWSASIDTLDNTGSLPLRLLAPAALRVGVDGSFALRHATLQSPGGTIELGSLRREAGAWSSNGRASRLDPTYWARVAGVGLHGLRSDLRLAAAWDLRTGPAPTLHLELQRSSGDLVLPAGGGLPLGLSRLALRVDAGAGSLHAALDAAGARLGSLQAGADLGLRQTARGWSVDPQAPLSGRAKLDMPELSWLSGWLPQGARAAGALRGELRASGTPAAPQLQGSLAGKALALALPEIGLDLRDGSLDAVFDGDRLRLRSLRVDDASGQGSLQASGSMGLADGLPSGAVAWKLDRLQALDRPGRQVQLSGSGTLRAVHGQVALDAALHVDKADIELASAETPRLAPDVVVQGRPAPAPAGSGAMPVSAQLRLDLGRDFHLGGYGVDARLGGALLLRADPGQPLHAEGSVAVRSGTYSAYGQQLSLVAGSSVNFSGPVDNPGLNLAAQRDNLPVQVGVRVTGTLRAPQVALNSDPPMSDGAILSWLVLGQDPSTVGSDQNAALQTAAAALLSSGQGVPLTSRLAGALGLDQLTLSGQGGLQNSVVTVGKKLSSRLSVSIEQGLAAASSLFNVRYTFTRRLSLRLQSGTDNAVDLFYTFHFD
ncbi:MAG: translocation/assembly module TamB domain-containing protein [Betaproteobacteria bacterium]|nr:translocation/assembly module TamB domain-containing protein [Betaproteobacteria bacterium]